MKTTLTLFALCRTIAIGVCIAGLAACSTTPNFDSYYGNSLNILKAQQIIDPAASLNAQTTNMDGQAAREAIERYNNSFKTPTPQPSVFTIGIGSGG